MRIGPQWETQRLAAVEGTGFSEGMVDGTLDAVARLAAEACGTPISAVSLVAGDSQWFVGAEGLPCRSTGRDVAFCAYTILGDEPMIVEDATRDDRFVSNPLVTGEMGIRFYAGIPLMTGDGLAMGSLCVIDTEPRSLRPDQVELLKTLGWLVSAHLNLRRRNRELIEQELLRNELASRLTKTSERVPGVIYQFRLRPDGTMCFPYASNGIRSIYRVEPSDVADNIDRVVEKLHPDDVDEVMASIARSAADLAPWKHEYRVDFGGGDVRWLLGDAVPEREADGGTLWHGFISDVTERKRAEQAMERLNEELQEATRQAESSSRAKSAFLSNMSHEIRTPLTSILGYAEMLSDPEVWGDSAQRHQITETIRSAGHHLQTIINDILDLSKIDAGRMRVECVETDLAALTNGLMTLVNAGADRKGLEFTVEHGSGVPGSVLCDPTRVRQILVNLIGNAIKFTDAGHVRVGIDVAERDGSRVLSFEVDDSGIGIEPEHRRHLFTSFAQADETVTRRYGGTGLGLSISRELARLMDGDIELVRSAPGRGSCFRFWIPLRETASGVAQRGVREGSAGAAPAAARGEAEPETRRISGRVLLAEDGPDNQRIIAFHLKRAGAELVIAGNGREALDAIGRAEAAGNPFDLLVTDIQMPEMDGYTLVRSLRERGHGLPVLALSAFTLEENRASCRAAGCDAFLPKPIDPHLLVKTCAAMVAGDRLDNGVMLQQTRAA